MKKFFIATFACAALASCYNNDTTIATNLEPINFGDNFVENAVRAVKADDPSYGTHKPLTSIIVYGAVEGVNIFPGVTVEDTVGTTEVEGVAQPKVWVQKDGTVQYWIAGANYTFDAVAGVEKSAVTTDNTANGTGLPTSIHYEVAKQTDMLHQRVTTTGKPDTNNGLVAFTFTHLLSKVKLTVENTTAVAATGYRYTISDIQLTNVRTKGDYAVPAGTWSVQETGTSSIADITVASGATEECAKEVLLIPGANVGISFKVNTQMKKGEEWVTITTSELKVYNNVKTLVANSAYNFKVSLGLNDQIKFTVTEQPAWDTPDETVNL